MAYENTQVTLVVQPGDIEAAIADSLSMPFSEFITKFVGDLLSGGEVVPGSSDLSNFCGMTETRSPSFKAVLAFLVTTRSVQQNKKTTTTNRTKIGSNE